MFQTQLTFCHRLLLATCLLLPGWSGPLTSAAHASAGLAEWTITTPGGHLISHSDGWKEQHGDCLRANDLDGPLTGLSRTQQVYVAHLTQWRYYPDFVVGKTTSDYFVFQESTKKVLTFKTKARFERHLKIHLHSQPISDWLAPMDAWKEAWFPFMFWKPCQLLMSKKPKTHRERQSLLFSGMNPNKCRKELQPERLAYYASTTWGDGCRRLLSTPKARLLSPFIRSFCRQIKAHTKPSSLRPPFALSKFDWLLLAIFWVMLIVLQKASKYEPSHHA